MENKFVGELLLRLKFNKGNQISKLFNKQISFFSKSYKFAQYNTWNEKYRFNWRWFKLRGGWKLSPLFLQIKFQ